MECATSHSVNWGPAVHAAGPTRSYHTALSAETSRGNLKQPRCKSPRRSANCAPRSDAQVQFARAVALGLGTVTHLENGSRPPDPQSLVALAQAARESGRHDLAETFVRALPGVHEGLL